MVQFALCLIFELCFQKDCSAATRAIAEINKNVSDSSLSLTTVVNLVEYAHRTIARTEGCPDTRELEDLTFGLVEIRDTWEGNH